MEVRDRRPKIIDPLERFRFKEPTLRELRTEYLADFAYHFHIRPWEIGLLTFDEFKLLIEQVKLIDRKVEPNVQ